MTSNSEAFDQSTTLLLEVTNQYVGGPAVDLEPSVSGVRRILRFQPAAPVVSVALVRRILRFRAAALVVSVALVRRILRFRAVTPVVSVALVRRILRFRAAAPVVSVALVRRILRLRAVTPVLSVSGVSRSLRVQTATPDFSPGQRDAEYFAEPGLSPARPGVVQRRLRSFWLAVSILFVSLMSAQAQPKNVIFILSDDHRYDFMSFHENAPDFLETPSLDRMAAEGLHIKNAFVTTSLCSPSRASIFTGQYAHHHKVVDNTSPLPPEIRFFPSDLQTAGYQTAFMGKWHMGEDSDDPKPGFDKWISFRGQGVYYNPTLNVDGERKRYEGYTTDLLTDFAIDWLKDRTEAPETPFFLFLSHKAVHAEFEPAERHAGRYANVKIPYPASMANTESNYRDKPAWVKEQRYGWHGVDYAYHGQLDFDTFYKRYAETLLGVDESVGRVLDFVDENGLAENTIVFYMGDNGFMLGEHGLIDKRQAYEESIRVPMLAYAPGFIDPGSATESLIRNIDIAPTILSIAGVSVPERMDGQSFLPVLSGDESGEGREFLYEYYWEYSFPHTPTVFALRGDRYKYIFYHGVWDIQELYDLELDPKEMRNLVFAPEHRERVAAMRNRMFDLLEQTDGMTIPLKRATPWQASERKLH